MATQDDEEAELDMDSLLNEGLDAAVETQTAASVVVTTSTPQQPQKPSIDFDEEEELKKETEDEDILAESLLNAKKKDQFKIPRKESSSKKEKEEKPKKSQESKTSDSKKRSKLSPPVEPVRDRSSSPSSSRKRERSVDNDPPEEKKRRVEPSKHSVQHASLATQDGPTLKREADRLFSNNTADCFLYYIEAGLKFLDVSHYSPDKAIRLFEQSRDYFAQVLSVTSKKFPGENIRLGVLYVLHAYSCKEIDRLSRDRMQSVKSELKKAVNNSSPNGNGNQSNGNVVVKERDLKEFMDMQRTQIFFLDSLSKSAEYLESLKSPSAIQKYMFKCTYAQLVSWVRDVLGKL